MKTAAITLAILALAGCQRDNPVAKTRLAQVDSVSAQRDSLMQQVVDNARLVSDLTAALSKVHFASRKDMPVAESPMQASRDSLLWMVKDIAARVNSSESRLRASQRRIRALNGVSDSLKAHLDSTVAEMQGIIDQQKNTITNLTAQVTALQGENAELTTAKVALQDTVQHMDQMAHMAYYVVGTKDDLLKRGIIREVGGARTLFIFGKRGTVLRPAPDLDVSAFTPIDERQVTQIALPDSLHTYKIASNQDLAYLADSTARDGEFRGSALQITSPAQFWMPSKFLIIVKS